MQNQFLWDRKEIQIMSSTNKTTNYDLSQYIGTDKPTYLGDYNSDMLKIDNALKNNADGVSNANAIANQANANSNQALTNAESAQNTANTANGTANSALTKANANETNINKFNLSTIVKPTLSCSVSGASFIQYQNMETTVARDESGSVFKLYGGFEVNCKSESGYVTVTLSDTGLRPQEDYWINPCGIKIGLLSSGTSSVQPFNCKVKTNGEIELNLQWNSSFVGARVLMFPCLFFNQNFGD
jgi:hypothetical protein